MGKMDASDRRQHERIEVYASVQLRQNDDTLVLAVKDISLGGVFLHADAHDFTAFQVGRVYELMVFDATDEQSPPLTISAWVVRREPTGIALMWSGKHDLQELETMIARLRRT